MNRRVFLRQSAVIAAFSPAALRAADRQRASSVPAPVAPPAARTRPRSNKKGFMQGMLRGPATEKEAIHRKFQLLRESGFHGVEIQSALNQRDVIDARDAAGLEIPSVIIVTHWTHPLSSPDPAVRATGVAGLEQGLRDAKAYGASSVLLVPGAVNKEVSYRDAYTRSMAGIKRALPLAERLGVEIAIENVWNHFLLSPLEAVQFVDAFDSPYVRWHLDVGNLVSFGWPEHWIEALGSRIAKVHVKEYSRKRRDELGPGQGFRVDLMEGDSDWPAVMAALDKINYTGWLVTEQYRPPGRTEPEHLTHLVQKLDQILAS